MTLGYPVKVEMSAVASTMKIEYLSTAVASALKCLFVLESSKCIDWINVCQLLRAR